MLEIKTSLGLRSGFQVKFLLSSLRLVDRVSNPKPNKGIGISSPIEKTTCEKCGKKHYGDCKRTDNCFGCGKSGH